LSRQRHFGLIFQAYFAPASRQVAPSRIFLYSPRNGVETCLNNRFMLDFPYPHCPFNLQRKTVAAQSSVHHHSRILACPPFGRSFEAFLPPGTSPEETCPKRS